ncbi:putative plastidic glucose transporter 2 [Acorus calamus]|uniref:Plastidic glucose transporter 2 n=1 Tax=Acorus calamus TaxID=4465 RepID=A0AAV9CNR7_ACOCL|nr:putative plastidic glucose transporter 2 [Acorus calamus]
MVEIVGETEQVWRKSVIGDLSGDEPPSRHSCSVIILGETESYTSSNYCKCWAKVVNETLESISLDLGFGGNTLAEDGIGRRRAFQLSALPMIVGAAMSATSTTLHSMLLGRLLVGTGMGLGPPVASLYVTEVSPSFVRGTYGSFIQIATCLGLIVSLFAGIPSKSIGLRGRLIEAEAEFERLLGVSHVKSAMSELSRSGGDEIESVKLSELLYGRHFRGSIVAMMLMDKLGRKVLLLGSFLGMAIAMCVQVAATTLPGSAYGALYLSVGGMLMFVLSFALGAGPVPGLLLPEIFPNRIRAKAMAICGEFLCRFAVLTFARAVGAAVALYDLLLVLLFGGNLCEEECSGDERKVSPGNRDIALVDRVKNLWELMRQYVKDRGKELSGVSGIHFEEDGWPIMD